MVVDTMASHNRTKFYNKTATITVGQNNASPTKAKAHEETDHIWLDGGQHDAKADNIQAEATGKKRIKNFSKFNCFSFILISNIFLIIFVMPNLRTS